MKAKNSIIDYPEIEQDIKEEKTSLECVVPEQKKKTMLIIKIIIGIIISILVIFAAITAINLNSKTIFNNITIGGIPVGKLSKEEAQKKIEEATMSKLNTELTLQQEEVEMVLTPSDIEGKYDIEKAIDEAYSIGRYGNIFSNNFNMLALIFKKQEIQLSFLYNQEKLDAIVTELDEKFPELEESSYEVKDGKLVIKKGHKGIEVKPEIAQEILNNIQTGENKTLEIPVIVKLPAAIDIEKIYEEIHKEPKDAYYTKDPFEIHEHEQGVDFKISLEEAKQLLEEDKEEYIIELEYKDPDITTDEIGTEAFPDLLSSYSTTYITSKVNRTTNLKLASNQINGVVVMPGETFSYNKTVGPRTAERGFKEAGIYSGGEVVDGLGGGICQISSTLYNIVLLANLEIVERENHQFLPGYVPAGKDATVVYGSIDFKFKNNRDYPVKIVSSVGGGYVKMQLYGMKEDNEYDVSIQTTVLQTIYPQTVYRDTSSLKEGVTKVQDSGQNGCKSETYRILKKDGKVVSKELLSKDTYSAMKKVVLRGTKKETTNTQTTSNQTTEKPEETKPEENQTQDPEPENTTE